ncbi:MAG: flagella basal body P-ring formation protein FlgA [Candidatus Riflebacteria bacterium]|nr:flagella basal body P-ring formation protein FlgA [Candidatus Riflebacteria bacterium]
MRIKLQMRKTCIMMLFCGISLGLCSSSSAAINKGSGHSSITSFKSTALVSGSEIKADSLIKSDCSDKIRDELAGIQIGHNPHPLGELVINRQELHQKLGKLASSIDIPQSITIRRLGSILKSSDISEEIRSICEETAGEGLTIDLSRVPSNIVLPGNLIDYELVSNSNNALGMKLFVLNAHTDGGPFRQLLQVKISKTIEAAQLVRLAKPGELISSAMVRPKKIELKSEQTNLPVSYKEAVGKCLGRFKSSGTVLRSSDLSTGPGNMCASRIKAPAKAASLEKTGGHDEWVIQPGENVDFHVNSGTLSLKIPAKAVQGGNTGDEITLINLQNKRRIRGIITEKGTVEYAQK